MTREEFDAWEERIRERAEGMWNDAGRPDGGADQYMDEARELVALSEVVPTTLDPNAADVIEESSLQRNLGEFPTLVDQGDEQTFPDDLPDGEDDIRLSDGDASDNGGVLPEDASAGRDLPDVSAADADIASSTVDSDDDDLDPDDLNDDGLPDRPTALDEMKDEDA